MCKEFHRGKKVANCCIARRPFKENFTEEMPYKVSLSKIWLCQVYWWRRAGVGVGRWELESVRKWRRHSRQKEEQMQMWQNMGKYGLLGSSRHFHRTWNGDEDVGREPERSGRWDKWRQAGELVHHSVLCRKHWRGLGMRGSQGVCVLNNSGGCVGKWKSNGRRA